MPAENCFPICRMSGGNIFTCGLCKKTWTWQYGNPFPIICEEQDGFVMNTDTSFSPSQINQSAEKTMRIIELLANSPQPMRLMDIARALNMNTSTASRFLTTLSLMHYVEQEKNSSRYYLTFRICQLANRIQSHTSLRDMVNPYLQELCTALSVSACLAIEQNQQVVYIDVAHCPDQSVQGLKRIGNIAPLHCTGIGKLFLLNYSVQELYALQPADGFLRYTSHTLTTVEELLPVLEKARTDGYALDNEECEIGTRCIALPIRDFSGKIIAGFSVTGSSACLTEQFLQKNIPMLKELSSSLSEKMGYEAF